MTDTSKLGLTRSLAINEGRHNSFVKSDARNILTILASKRRLATVARVADIVEGLTQQVKREAGDLERITAEMSTLRDAYQRYRELSDQVKAKEEKARLALGLIANQPLDEDDDPLEASEFLRTLMVICKASGIVLPKMPEDAATEAPLWKILREIVRQVDEVQIVELERVVDALGIKTTRQAIQSALETHGKTFRQTKRGREKYVSLKAG